MGTYGEDHNHDIGVDCIGVRSVSIVNDLDIGYCMTGCLFDWKCEDYPITEDELPLSKLTRLPNLWKSDYEVDVVDCKAQACTTVFASRIPACLYGCSFWEPTNSADVSCKIITTPYVKVRDQHTC